jgi:hypothetical protein
MCGNFLTPPRRAAGPVAPPACEHGDGAVLAPSGQGGGSGCGSLRLRWFASSDSSGQLSLGAAETPPRGSAAGDPSDTWLAAQANAAAPSGANSVLFSMHGWSISGPSSDYQINFDDVFLVQAPAPPPQPTRHAQKIYQNPAGTPFAPIQDIAAFAACP